MKSFAFFLLIIGLVSANLYHDVLDKSGEKFLLSFEKSLQDSPSLSEAVGETSDELEKIDSDTKSQLVNSLREALQEVIKQIKDRIDERHQDAKELIEKANEIIDRLHEAKSTVGQQAKDLLQTTKNKVGDIFRKLLDRVLGNREKRDLTDQLLLEELELVSLFEKAKEKLSEKVDFDEIRSYLKEVFGEGSKLSEAFLDALKAHGTDGLKRVMDTILKVVQQREKRETEANVVEKVHGFLKNIVGHMLDRYEVFAQWMQTVWARSIEHAGNSHEQFKEIAKELLDDIRDLHKETIREALEILRPHKEDLGVLWQELLDASKKVFSKKD